MSATNRGAVRNEQDFYATPEGAFKPLLPYLLDAPRPTWEPACGDGRLIRWMNEAGIDADGSDLSLGVDFLADDTSRERIVTNPPFSIAEEFIHHCAQVTPDFYLLLRLNFLGGQKRFLSLWRKHAPNALFVLSSRPSFGVSIKCVADEDLCGWRVMLPQGSARIKMCPECGCDTTCSISDACDYAWFYWGDDHTGVHFLV